MGLLDGRITKRERIIARNYAEYELKELLNLLEYKIRTRRSIESKFYSKGEDWVNGYYTAMREALELTESSINELR
jgi:hypothetical protein